MAKEDMMNIAIRVALIVIAAIIVIFLITYYSNPKQKTPANDDKKGVEKFNTQQEASPKVQDGKKSVRFADTPAMLKPPQPPGQQQQQQQQQPMPSDPESMEDYIAVDYETSGQKQHEQQQHRPSNFFPQDKTTPEDLLPKDAANSKWAQVAPAGQGDVKNQNFLTAGFLVGKDTIGVSRKNPNLTLRSEPPNPKNVVSPWMNSTIEPDQYRRGFEIGSSA